MKLCKDCAHFVVEGEKCGRTIMYDYVHGKHRMFSASVERGSLGKDDCGNDGKFWEAKQNEQYVTNLTEKIISYGKEIKP